MSSDRQQLADYYGTKQEVVFTATGSAALHLALQTLGVLPGHTVVVPTHTCHLVAASVRLAGAAVHFVEVGDDLVLKPEHLTPALLADCAAIVAVHAYGLPCHIGALRERVGERLPIIEDASLAFDLSYGGFKVGTHSDVVVASFGRHKPLSLEQGGALFSDDDRARQLLERYGAARYRSTPPCPYILSPLALKFLGRAIRRARRVVAEARTLAAEVQPSLHRAGFAVWQPAPGDQPTWHRIPLRGCGEDALWRFAAADPEGLVIETPHRVPLQDLPMFKDCSLYSNSHAGPARTGVFLKTGDAGALRRCVSLIMEECRPHE